jgi:hypothetical protein
LSTGRWPRSLYPVLPFDLKNIFYQIPNEEGSKRYSKRDNTKDILSQPGAKWLHQIVRFSGQTKETVTVNNHLSELKINNVKVAALTNFFIMIFLLYH